jgi:hypothetical protein
MKTLQQKYSASGMQNKMIPAIMGATETISKLFRKYLSNITEKDKTRKKPKTAIFDTAHILQKILM